MGKKDKITLKEDLKNKQILFTLSVSDTQFYKTQVERIFESVRLIEKLSTDEVIKKLCKNIRDNYNLDTLIHFKLTTELLNNITNDKSAKNT